MQRAIADYPKLRAVEAHWIERMGQPALLLQDRLAIGARTVVVPQPLAPLLALCDGTRDVAGLRAALELRTGLRLDVATVERVLAQLDEALLLENDRFARAYREVVESFRAAPYRPPLLAGSGYPADAGGLAALLERHLRNDTRRDGGDSGGDAGTRVSTSPDPLIRGLICPHIDYERGADVYARVWDLAREAVDRCDLFIIIGTDHGGGPAELTLTLQSYHTPFGTVSTDVEAVKTVASAIGEEAAFRSELNHRAEHSIELAVVWLQHLAAGRDIRAVPVLCGSFQPFLEGGRRPMGDARWQAAIEVLRRLAERERTLVVIAADLAHVGPAFGDQWSVGSIERATLAAADAEMLETVGRGDAEGFLSFLAREGDRRRVCGLPPIYLGLSVLGQAQGELVSYRQCPAPSGSMVSVAGVLLR